MSLKDGWGPETLVVSSGTKKGVGSKRGKEWLSWGYNFTSRLRVGGDGGPLPLTLLTPKAPRDLSPDAPVLPCDTPRTEKTVRTGTWDPRSRSDSGRRVFPPVFPGREEYLCRDDLSETGVETWKCFLFSFWDITNSVVVNLKDNTFNVTRGKSYPYLT